MYFGDAPDGLLLSNGIRTGVAALAVLAELAEVELVDPFHHRAEVFFLVGDEAGFEISAERALGSHAGSGEICRADEALFPIDDDRFGVNARAEDALEEIALDERRIAIEVLAEARSRFLGMEEANGNSFVDEV